MPFPLPSLPCGRSQASPCPAGQPLPTARGEAANIVPPPPLPIPPRPSSFLFSSKPYRYVVCILLVMLYSDFLGKKNIYWLHCDATPTLGTPEMPSADFKKSLGAISLLAPMFWQGTQVKAAAGSASCWLGG